MAKKTDDEFSAVLITLGRECFELEKKLRAKREKNEKAHQEMVKKCERQQKEDENHRQDMHEMFDAVCGEYKRQEEELQKERAVREKDHQKLLSSEARERKKMVTAMLIGGFVGAALIQNYDPTWWKRLRQTLDNWWQPPELSLCDKFARGDMVRSQK